jgi:hypothetical protein
MKTKPQYEVKTCSACKGKGTVRGLVEVPGTFEVSITMKASFQVTWNDAGDSTVKDVEDDVRMSLENMFYKREFANTVGDELNTSPEKLTHHATITVKKIK